MPRSLPSSAVWRSADKTGYFRGLEAVTFKGRGPLGLDPYAGVDLYSTVLMLMRGLGNIRVILASLMPSAQRTAAGSSSSGSRLGGRAGSNYKEAAVAAETAVLAVASSTASSVTPCRTRFFEDGALPGAERPWGYEIGLR